MKLAKRIGKDTGLYSIGPILAKLLSILLIPIYTAHLSTSDFGLLSYVLTIGSFCLPFITMGMGSTFWMYYKGSMNDNRGEAIYITNMISTLIGLPVVLISLIYYIANSDLQSYLIFVYLSALTLRVFYNRGLKLLRAQNRIVSFLMASSFFNVLHLISAIVLVVFLSLNVVGVIYAHAIVFSLGGLIAVVYMKRYWIQSNHLDTYKKYLSYGWPIMLGNIGAISMNLVDKFALNFLSDKAELGLYAYALRFAAPFSAFIFAPFMKAWVPLRWEIYKRDNCRQSFSKVAGTLSTLLPASVLGFTGIAVVGARLLTQRSEYLAALTLIPILALTKVLYGLYWYDLMGFLFTKRTKFFPVITALMGVFNIVFNIILVTKFGAMGAAIATVMTYILTRVIVFIFSQKVYPYRRNISAESIVLIATFVFAGLLSAVTHYSGFVYILISFTFAIVIVIIGIKLRLVSSDHIKKLYSSIRKRLEIW